MPSAEYRRGYGRGYGAGRARGQRDVLEAQERARNLHRRQAAPTAADPWTPAIEFLTARCEEAKWALGVLIRLRQQDREAWTARVYPWHAMSAG